MNYINVIVAALVDGPVRNVLGPIFMILMALMGIAEIVIVMMQKSSDGSIGAIGGQESEIGGKNKTNSKERILRILTIVFGVVILLLSVCYFILYL